MAKKNTQYKEKEYWDERYETEESYDWFKGYDDFKSVLKNHMNTQDRILMLGCGNSPFSEHLYKDGYRNIVNIDYSHICIEKMEAKCKDLAEMKWLVMDIMDLKFGDASFDLVIDKGTLDAILTDQSGFGHLCEKAFDAIEVVLTNVSRVLVNGGRFVSITFAQPLFRKKLYVRSIFGWNVQTFSIGEGGCLQYFVYVMEKGKQLSDSDKQLEIVNIKSRNDFLNPKINDIPNEFFEEDTNGDFLSNIQI
nr:EEF1A lysine methyltransferase 4-like [Ciona intestinalis]|eukprot:XP_026691000.1 EEF1A lysine methyltransferase 4-like [Ciona intestinalis]